MSKRTVYHVVPAKGKKKWQVTKEDRVKPVKSFVTKQAAVAFGRNLGRKEKLGQLKVHGLNGKIQTEHTYGQDPIRYPS